MQDIKKKSEQSKNPTSISRRERRKKLTRIKDTLHRGCGKKVYCGFDLPGKKKEPLTCDICKEIIYSCTSEVINGKIINYCKKTSCRDEINKIKKGLL
jgi:formylmethanofuran dehydrogenase subunit E